MTDGESLITTPDINSKKLVEIAANCEKLIQTTERELSIHETDKFILKDEILKVLTENQFVQKEIENLKNVYSNSGFEEKEKHKKLTKNAIDILKGQIKCLKDERDTIQTLWETSKDTITNLESEICNYRDQIFKPNAINEIKARYAGTITLLENTVKCLRIELNKQLAINKEILKTKIADENRTKSYENRIEELKNKLFESDKNKIIIESLKVKLEKMGQKNLNLEINLKNKNLSVDERIHREKLALDKIQEALQVAEEAIADKDEALKREVVIREECDNLATTIGEVMEEAAVKVEKDIEKLQMKHDEQLNKIENEKNLVLKQLEIQQKQKNLAEIRSQTIEKKLKDVVQENVALDADLQVASQAIVQLELKLEAIESLMSNKKQTNSFSEEREKEIEQYLLNNQEIKKKWKNAIEDVTKKFEKEITSLNNDNCLLRAKVQELSLKLIQHE